MTPAPRPLWRGRAMAVTGVLLLAFSLRSAVASLSPIVDHIEADYAVPAWVLGLIGTAPPVCFALFGLITPVLERRFGLERLGLAALLLVAAGLAGRGLASDPGSLLLCTTVVFAGVGVGNVLLPPLVKTYFPDRIGLMTTAYTTAMALSTFLPPLFAVPVADAAGWRLSLGMWAIFAVLAMAPWIVLLVRRRAEAVDIDIETVPARVFGRLWRLPTAWAVTVTFLVSSSIAYTGFAWLPTLLVDIAEVSAAQAGSLLSLFGAVGLPASLLVPILVTRYRAVPALFVVAVGAGLTGVAGLMFAPAVAPWLWVTLLGLTPLYFPLALVLLGLRTRTHEAAVALSGFVQSIGYAIAAMVPLAFGVLHELTGSWIGPLGLLAVVITASIPAGFIAARTHTVEEEWERRGGRW